MIFNLNMDFPGGSEAKNPPLMQETRVWSLGQEDPLVKGNPLQYSCQEIPMDKGAWQAIVLGSQRVKHNWSHTYTTLI